MLWRIGSAYPPPGEHVLRFPFSFPIPPDVPPSMKEEGRHLASITYTLYLCAERNVTFGFDIHIERSLIVVPPDLNTSRFRSRRGGDLVRMGRMELSRSIFNHGKGHFEVKLNIPGQKHRPFPIGSKVPFTVTVSTFSVPVYENSDPRTDKDALCPSIDMAALHLLLRLKLKRYTALRVRGALSTKEQTVSSQWTLPNFQQKGTLNVDVGPKVWVACTGDDQKLNGKGHWKQQFIFHSSISLTSQLVTPTFKHRLIDVSVRIILFLCINVTAYRFVQVVCAQA